ncbi:MAG: hypothetical protein P4L70_06965 [Parasulfuritortus sp.]|jgi:hypothetical protein|nr:hypothetical protein [Parasulfuritortus sp.]
MTEKQNWKLQPGIEMSGAVAEDVAKVSCALKSLSAFTTFIIEREDCPEDLKKIVEEGLEAMSRIYVW